jgi:hypothetical protein
MPFLSILIFLLLPLSILLILLPTLSSLSLGTLSIFEVLPLLLLIVVPFFPLIPIFPLIIFSSLWRAALLSFPLPYSFRDYLFFLSIMFSFSIVSTRLSIIFSITIYFYLLRGVEGRLIPPFLRLLACLHFRVILYLAEIRRWAGVCLGGWL